MRSDCFNLSKDHYSLIKDRLRSFDLNASGTLNLSRIFMQILTSSDSYRYVVATSMSSTKVMNSLIDLSVSVKDKRHKYHEDILRSYEQEDSFIILNLAWF